MYKIEDIKIDVWRYPTKKDWDRAKIFALNTVGKKMVNSPTGNWKQQIIRSEHSPIRTLMFSITMKNIPYYSSVHFSRHKYGVEHYVSSQRNDRQSSYDRNSAPQNAPVTHIMDINAQELIYMARKRLCKQADETTRYIMQLVVKEVLKKSPEFEPFLVSMCKYLGRCDEFTKCSDIANSLEKEVKNND